MSRLINANLKRPVKRRVKKKVIKRFMKYYRNPKNEFGFLVLSMLRKWTFLPANILIDDSGLWTNLAGKKIILFQTNDNEDRDFDCVLPMSIENEPEILVKNEKIELSNSEIEQIKDFVIKCQGELLQIGSGKIHVVEFSEAIRDKGFHFGKKQKIIDM